MIAFAIDRSRLTGVGHSLAWTGIKDALDSGDTTAKVDGRVNSSWRKKISR